jgi:3-hydroxybutyryl-CoA dehydrogenase
MSAPLPGPALVIGGGTMAVGIAARLAAARIDTSVLVRRAEVAPGTLAEVHRRVARLVELNEAAPTPAPNVSVLVNQPGGPYALVVESISEDTEAKRAVLARAEELVERDGIVATNTSSLPLSELAADLSRPALFAGWHWFNPAELVPLVEVVGGPGTAAETLVRLTTLSRAIGKQPIVVRRDVAGFVANRLQYALLREAYSLVEAGVCDVADVDRAVVDGLGARWAGIGPFAAMDAAGLDVHEAVAEQLFPQLSRATGVPALLRRARRGGANGVKSGDGLCGAYGPEAAHRLAERRDTVLALLSRAHVELP